MTATPVFPQTIKTNVAQILPADTTTLKTLITAPANGVRVDSILISSTDTSARDLQLVVTISSVDYVLGTLQIPANAGFTNAVPTVGAFQHSQLVGLNTDVNGNKFLFLASGAVLKVKALTTVTAAKAISVIAQCGEF